jgi:hypothetical protein
MRKEELVGLARADTGRRKRAPRKSTAAGKRTSARKKVRRAG